jgi:argininosuccinate synthase
MAKVMLSLYKGNVIVIGRESPTSLYDEESVKYGTGRRL